jgi:hypothetical protein
VEKSAKRVQRNCVNHLIFSSLWKFLMLAGGDVGGGRAQVERGRRSEAPSGRRGRTEEQSILRVGLLEGLL